MKTIFFGNFFLKESGTLSISQKLVNKLDYENIEYVIGSKYKSKILRIFETIFKMLFYKYDNIHVDVFSGYAFNIPFIISITNFFRRKKIILNLRGGRLTEYYSNSAFNTWKVNFVLNNAKVIVSPSKFLINFFKNYNFNISYFPNYINYEDFPYNEDIVSNNQILWVRGFHEIYNPKDAVMSFYYLLKKMPSCNLTMIGPDKGIMDEVKILIKKLKLESKINILGPINNSSLHKYFHSHEVFINTTSYESFGQALLESASSGCPIVSYSVGEIPYIWDDNENILLCESNDPIDMSQKIYNILNDRELLKKLKFNAYKKSSKYEWKNLRKSWLSLLKQ